MITISKRLVSGVGLLFCLGLVSSQSVANDEMRPSGAEGRTLLWQAALRVVAEQGLSLVTASQEDGVIKTGFAPLDVGIVSQVTRPNNALQEAPWAGAEYRYEINFGKLSDRLRIAAKAEIRAWPHAAPEAETKQFLPSNLTLEREFVQALTRAVGQVAGQEE